MVNELTLLTNFKVTSADTDMEARLRPGAMVNMLIQSAIQSADTLGFGFGGLQQEKLLWVLSRMTIKIERALKWYDEVEVETWPKDVDGLLYLRDFIIRDSSKNCVAKATSGWLAIDLDTRRPKKIEGINASILDFLKSKHAIESAPDKLPPTSEGKQFEKQIAYFDIDLNRHVTATRYVDWMMDSLPVDFLMSHYPTKLSINYMKETKLGDTILLNSTQPVENQIRFEGINKGTDHSSFRGMIEFSQAEK